MAQIANSPDATNNYDIAGIDTYAGAAVGQPNGGSPNGTPTYPYGPGAILGKKGAAWLTGAAAMAMTLALPSAATDDGKTLTVYSTTAFAHTITAPVGVGAFKNGAAVGNILTFGAAAGNQVTMKAYNGFWVVTGSVNVTLSGT
jgi:hypothetical protein